MGLQPPSGTDLGVSVASSLAQGCKTVLIGLRAARGKSALAEAKLKRLFVSQLFFFFLKSLSKNDIFQVVSQKTPLAPPVPSFRQTPICQVDASFPIRLDKAGLIRTPKRDAAGDAGSCRAVGVLFGERGFKSMGGRDQKKKNQSPGEDGELGAMMSPG